MQTLTLGAVFRAIRVAFKVSTLQNTTDALQSISCLWISTKHIVIKHINMPCDFKLEYETYKM